MTYRVGLSGLIGSGKSIVSNYFIELGITVIDTDVISHELTSINGDAICAIVKIFGTEYLKANGSLDRDKMRKLVFSNLEEKSKLELILHPLILNEVKRRTEQSLSLYTIIVVPLLFQAPDYLDYVQSSIFVNCDRDALVRRVIQRNNFSRETVLKILETHLDVNKQIKLADYILENNSTLENLQEQVINLDQKLKLRLKNNSTR